MGSTNAKTHRVIAPSTNRRWRGVIIGLFIIGLVMTLWHPIWFLPNVSNSVFLYVPIYFLWLVILIIASVTHHFRIGLQGVVRVICIFIVQGLIGYFLVLAFSISVGTEPTCSQVMSGIVVNYTCQSNSIFAPLDCAPSVSHYEFVGLQGLPVVI